MNTRLCLVVPVASLLLLLPHPIAGQRNNAAMAGQVTSVEEGPMEGVLVSARKAGSMITTTVVTDQQGRYAFPRARLEPGDYALRIRAIGYEMERPVTVSIRGQQATTADLTLRKTHDLASQLTNAG